MRKLFIAVAAMAVAVGMMAESRFAGVWNGVLSIGANRLPIVFNVADSAGILAVTLDSPAQGVFGLPAELAESGDTMRLSVPMIAVKYSGVRTDDAIVGTFSQQGYEFPLTMNFGPYVPQRPQTPQPPFPYNVQEVEFVNPIDSARLSGTLTVPYSYQMSKPGTVPAVVMVTGSGQQNRDEEIFNHKPFAVIAHALASNGIASLRYDDRGFGRSTGDFGNATTATFATDASAAVDFLKSQKKAFGKIGVLGHSEGGTIAFMLAAKGEPDFIVSLAGPAVAGDSIMYAQNERLLREMGLTETQLKEYIEGLSMVFSKMACGDKEQLLEINADRFPDLSPELIENLKSIASQDNAWMNFFVGYDPQPEIAKISCPVFALNGGLDIQVDAEINLAALRRLLPENEKTLIKSYPGLNHMFQHATTGMPGEYGLIDETISEEVLTDLVRWIRNL